MHVYKVAIWLGQAITLSLGYLPYLWKLEMARDEILFTGVTQNS